MYCCKKQNLQEPLEHDEQDRRSREEVFEDDLLKKLDNGTFREIKEIKPSSFKYCESNSLLMGMKVNFKLRRLANNLGHVDKRFNQLASSVENYTILLLDPLRSNQPRREDFGDCFDGLLDDAIQLQQKKFFTHPVVDTEIKRKWYGREFFGKTKWEKRWRALLTFWCLFDLVFSPILFAVFSLMQRKRKDSDLELEETSSDDVEKENLKKTKAKQHLSVPEIYLISLETPYFKFVRDTLSYIVLLVLHYALCLSPTTVTFSGLEWVILIFFIGRYLVERKQISDALERLKRQRDSGTPSKCIHLKALSKYLSDLWNKLDFISLLVYFVILILRVAALIMSGPAMNNRVLAVAGYLYSFNTLCLTFRVFGHVLERYNKDVGIVQIALFSILKDITTVIWQFTAAILAFSIAITKVYMVEKSFIASGSNDIVCKKSGISCWWTIITYLSWSLLGISDDSDPIKSVDFPSESLARILFAGFLIFGVILLINMLIALLSNTYQRIEDNSLQEWSYKSAVTIQTYDGYDPIPVPLNIIYSVAKLLRLVEKKEEENGLYMAFLCIDLDREYTAKYGNVFPLSDEEKADLLFREASGNREMVSQILQSTFKFQGGGDHSIMCQAGLEAWEAHTGIRIEGNYLTCEYVKHCPQCRPRKRHRSGARYLKSFSEEFPHFELVILETGKQIMVAIGVVNEGYDTSEMPGRKNGTVGYQIDGNVYDTENHNLGRATKGPVMAFRGDRIRCTVIFGEEREGEDGKKQVPICFTLNGRKILIKRTTRQEETDRVFMDYHDDKPLYPYISMTDGCSVLAKMCSRENAEQEISRIEDLTRKVTKMEESLMCSRENEEDLTRKVTKIEESLMCFRENAEHEISKVGDLTTKVTKIENSLEETNRKLDTLLARLPHQEQSG